MKIDKAAAAAAVVDTANPDEIDPWAARDAQAGAEVEGTKFEWRYGWSLQLRRLCGWNQKYASATDRIGRRADVRKFLNRTKSADYKWTDEDRQFWVGIEMEQFGAGCLVGWDVKGRDGKPLIMSPANVLMTFERFPDLYGAARAFALDPANFAADSTDEATKSGN